MRKNTLSIGYPYRIDTIGHKGIDTIGHRYREQKYREQRTEDRGTQPLSDVQVEMVLGLMKWKQWQRRALQEPLHQVER